LLDAAEAEGFDVLLTTDQNIRYQQNPTNRTIAIVVLGKGRWRLIQNRPPEIAAAVARMTRQASRTRSTSIIFHRCAQLAEPLLS
jgi:hypothetical protein